MATFNRISDAHFIDLNIEYRIMKISSSVSGMMIARRACARCCAFIFARPVDVVSAPAACTCVSTFWIASSTAPPRSRPRTLYLIAT